MIKQILISLMIGGVLSIIGFSIYVLGLYHAPQPSKYDQEQDLQYLCDTARREPWKANIKTACETMAEWWAIDYKCEDVIGCYTIPRKAE